MSNIPMKKKLEYENRFIIIDCKKKVALLWVFVGTKSVNTVVISVPELFVCPIARVKLNLFRQTVKSYLISLWYFASRFWPGTFLPYKLQDVESCIFPIKNNLQYRKFK